MIEIWKSVNGYEDFYEISNYGNIRILDRVRRGRSGADRKCKSKLMKGSFTGRLRNYLSVILTDGDKKERRFPVHRLVAFHFLKPPYSGETDVNHINAIKTDNMSCNLEWCTHKGNIEHSVLKDLQGKLRIKQVLEIYAEKGSTYSQLSKKYSISISSIHSIKTGKTWANITNHKP